MAESIGLIERAAALLRQREAEGVVAPIAQKTAELRSATPPKAAVHSPELMLDRSQLAQLGVAIPATERSLTAEEFRLIKRNLMANWAAGDRTSGARFNRIIMVTSARPGEGKTFVALNLALAFSSEREVKALLVDLDTHGGSRHSALKTILGQHNAAGIVDILAGSVDLDDVLIRTDIENLLMLPAGRGGPQVPELFSSSRMEGLLNELSRRFPDRFVILDTPPCMVSSDAATIAPLVGQIIFVVEAYRTQQDEIEASIGMLNGCSRISLLLNKSEHGSGHFGSYHYEYHYSTDNGDELPATGQTPG